MTTTTIEWAEQVWNPIVGCTVHSAGCTNCYAMRMAARLEAMADAGNHSLAHYRGTTRKVNGKPVWTGKLGFSETALLAPLKRKKPTRYFVNSMSDLFHEAVPDEWIDRVFAVMALCSQHTFQVLTKRSDRMRGWFAERWQGTAEQWLELPGQEPMHIPAGPETGRDYQVHMAAEGIVDELKLADTEKDDLWTSDGSLKIMQWKWPLPNVWLGVSVEDQRAADERIPDLLATPAAVRWISAEPLLSPLDLSKWLNDRRRESISGADCAWPIQHRPPRGDLASCALDGRRGGVVAVYPKDESGAELGARGQLPEGDVQGWLLEAQNIRSPHSVDGLQPQTNPSRDGDQPYQRQQAGQSAGEPRTGNAPAECAALPHDVGAEEEGPARREEFWREAELECRGGDSCALESQGNDAARNRSAVRRKTIDGTERHQPSKLDSPSLDWIVCGGESGPGARPMHPDWARSLRDQCQAAGVPFFFKQWGEWAASGTHNRDMLIGPGATARHPKYEICKLSNAPSAGKTILTRVGKKQAGRLLDGREWSEYPA